MSYAPYPAYKGSGVPWFDVVPVHWDVRRLKDVSRLKGGAGFPLDEQDVQGEELYFYKVGDLRLSKDGVHLDSSPHTISRTTAVKLRAEVIPKEAICYAKIGAALLLNRRRITTSNCCIDNNMTALLPRTSELYYKYAFYWMSTVDFSEHTNPGAVPSLSEGDQSVLPIALPPLEEQTAIADFLDRKTAEIDDLIAKKEELLRLLAEQRTALITHTVTKGLNPDSLTKPSGIDWLGDVPEEWDVRPISTAIQTLESGVSVNAMDVPAEDDQQGVLKTSAVYSGVFDPTQNKMIYDPVEAARLACPVRKGELIISRMNTPDLVGAVGIVEDEYPNLFLPDRLWQSRFWNQATASASFLYYFLNSKLFRAIISSLASGTSGSMQNITQSDLMKIRIGLPPLSEQGQIVDFLNQSTENIDDTRDKTNEAIQTLREYRTALITNAVTGKIKVV